MAAAFQSAKALKPCSFATSICSKPSRKARVVTVASSSSRSTDDVQEPGLLQKCALGAVAAALTIGPFSMVPPQISDPAHALLTAGDPIKNAKAILRNALPINNKPVRQMQRELESISDALRIPGSKSLGPVARSVRAAQSILSNQRAAIIASFAPDKKDSGLAAISDLEQALSDFQAIIDAKDKQEVPIIQQKALNYVGAIEEAMVSGFPFTIPAEYSNLPQLLGRATMEMSVSLSETPEGPQDVVLTLVADGYNAPLTAGNFVDLVAQKFYDGMEIQRADGFVVQTGDPEGPADGFIDPKTNQIRTIPLEVRVVGDKEPVYEFSLEDLGRYNDQPVLPFNAYGTMALARAEFENNSGSSQIFFLLKESELTPSGANLLDGRYAVFGYAVQGQDYLGSMKVGDKINYVKIVSGLENLKNATSS